MTHQRLKILFSVSSVLIAAAIFFLYLAAPYLGSIYLGMIQNVGDSLPRLTCGFALPMLRVDQSQPLHYPVTSWWVSIIWGLMMVMPVLIMIWSGKTTNHEECLMKWVGAMFIYFPILIIAFIAIIAGLLIAVAPFPSMIIR